MLKNVLKFLGIALGIVLIGAGTLFGVQYLRYRNSPEYQALQELEGLKRRYAEDQYGGATPEETLRLFIDALKRGDTELAAKYFVLDKQEEWRADLAKIQEKGLLDEMVRDLERPKEKKALVEGDESRFNYFIYNDDNILAVVIDVARGPNGKWKILDL